MHRELKEELGFDANKNDIIPFDIVLKENESNSHIGYRYYMFLDRDVKDFIIQEEELSEVKWIDFIEFKNMVINNNPNITFSNNKDNINTINKLEEIIRKHNK
jgi:8-oxo-dGTP pyrophosphatase MutT (NUDIX family)